MSYYNGKAHHVSKKWRYDLHHCRRWSGPRICGLRCEFCGDMFNEDKGRSMVLCTCGKDHPICGDCVLEYATTRKVDGFRYHSVKLCPDQGLKVARALMGDPERSPINKEDKW